MILKEWKASYKLNGSNILPEKTQTQVNILPIQGAVGRVKFLLISLSCFAWLVSWELCRQPIFKLNLLLYSRIGVMAKNIMVASLTCLIKS